MLSNLKDLIELGGDWLKNNVRNLFWVIRGPRSFFLALDLDNNPPVMDATIFVTFVSLLNLVISLPIYRQSGVEAESPSYLLVDTVLSVGYSFICASAFHAVAVMFRGRRSYQATIVCYLYMQAFSPLILLVSAPAQAVVTRRALLSGGGVISVAFYLDLMKDVLTSPVTLIGLGFMLLIFVYYFLCMVSAIRAVHQTGCIRAFMITSLGFSAVMLLAAFLGITIFQNFWQAFRNAPAK